MTIFPRIKTIFSKPPQILSVVGSLIAFLLLVPNCVLAQEANLSQQLQVSADKTNIIHNGKLMINTGPERRDIKIVHTKKFGNKEISIIQSVRTDPLCPGAFYMIVLEPNRAHVSQVFGNCSAFPQIIDKGNKLVIRFPQYAETPPADYLIEKAVLTEGFEKSKRKLKMYSYKV